MKAKRILVISAVLALCVGVTALAQSYPNTSWNVWQRETWDRLITFRDSVIRDYRQSGFNFRTPTTSDDGYYGLSLIRVGEYAEFTRMLYSGNDYIIVASGDSDIIDVDLDVHDRFGRLIASDYRIDRDAGVFITNPATGLYTFRIHLYSGRANTSWVGMYLLFDNY
jgi:hypothetical protein